MQYFLKNPNETINGVLCFTTVLNKDYGDIELRQVGKDNFTVRYGLQVDTELSYGAAAAKLGQALMHDMACEGKLDNRAKGER